VWSGPTGNVVPCCSTKVPMLEKRHSGLRLSSVEINSCGQQSPLRALTRSVRILAESHASGCHERVGSTMRGDFKEHGVQRNLAVDGIRQAALRMEGEEQLTQDGMRSLLTWAKDPRSWYWDS
jgi:hypothetical protein